MPNVKYGGIRNQGDFQSSDLIELVCEGCYYMRDIKNICFWIKEIWKMRKSMILLSVISHFISNNRPYIMVFFPSMIIEELSTYQRSEIILMYIFIIIISYMFCQLVLIIVNIL